MPFIQNRVFGTFHRLNAFTRAYIEAALWSSTDDKGEPLDARFDIDDIAPDTFAQMVADCEQFQVDNTNWAYMYENDEGGNLAPSRAGFCFWLNRNGHGSGFWDEDTISEPARTILSNASKTFGTFDLYIGDDGKVWGE